MFINWSKYSTKHVFEKKKSMQSIKARKYDKLLVFLYKQIDVCYRIMCYAFTECAYYNLLKEQNVFFFQMWIYLWNC